MFNGDNLLDAQLQCNSVCIQRQPGSATRSGTMSMNPMDVPKAV